MIQITPVKDIPTERLLLRPPQATDAADMFVLRSDEANVTYVHRPVYKKEDEAASFIKKINEGILENKWAFWCLVLPQTKRMIGTVCLWNVEHENYRAEIGYEIMPRHKGNGYMLEAVRAVMDYGFNQMKLHSITACLHPENGSSLRLLKKAGFEQEGYFRENVFYDNRFSDTMIYSILSPFRIEHA